MRSLKNLAVVTIALVWSVLVFAIPNTRIGDLVDDGMYFVGAQAIVNGEGYALPSRPYSPPALKYPPGVSLLTAGAMKLVAGLRVPLDSYKVGTLVSVLSGCLFIVFVVLLLEQFTQSTLLSLLAVVLTLFNPEVLLVAPYLMSDLPYAAVSAAFFFYWYQRVYPDQSARQTSVLLLGLLAGVALLIRSNGITLIAAFLIVTLTHQKRLVRIGNFLLGVGLIKLPVQVWLSPKATKGIAETYDGLEFYSRLSLAEMLPIATDKLFGYGGYLKVPATWIFPALQTEALVFRYWYIGLVLTLLITAVFLVGLHKAIRSLRPSDYLFAFNLVFALIVFFIWPYKLGGRPFIWVAPLLLLTFFSGLHRIIAQEKRPRLVGVLAYGCAGLLLLGILAKDAKMAARVLQYPPNPALVETFSFLQERLPSDSIVAATLPEQVYLYTGKQALRRTREIDSLMRKWGSWDEILAWRSSCSSRPLYLLMDDGDEGFQRQVAEKLIATSPFPLSQVFTSNAGRYRLLKVNW